MKVIEANSDRSAEMHIYVEGKVHALKEYGEYVDATDNAICCYVAIEDGKKPKISGNFIGTTKTIVGDVFIDGIHRKSILLSGKDIRHQKKKLEADTFLFKTEDGRTIDSQMRVTPLQVLLTKSESPETIGTIELRLYATRQLDVFHEVKNTLKYDADSTDRIAQYNRIAPTFQLDIERNSACISKQSETSHNKKMNSSRPGKAPWAIFRFHYRSEEEVEQHELEVTFDPMKKKLAQPRTLLLKPVPPLVPETKPPENRDSSLTPSTFLAGTPARRESPSKSSTPVQVQPAMQADSAAEPTTPTIELIENLQFRAFTKRSEMPFDMRSPTGTDSVYSPVSVSANREPTATADPKHGFNSSLNSAAEEVPTYGKHSELHSARTAAVSAKRFFPTVDEAPFGPKRPRILPEAIFPSKEPLMSQNTLGSNESVAMATELRVWDYRKKLTELHEARKEKKKELAAINAQMEEYRRCRDEELRRISQEVEQDEIAFAEDV